jgi:hypothetical protein
MGQGHNYRPEAAEVDGEDGQNGAELDQYLKSAARRVYAEEMTSEQNMTCRGHWYEFGQSLKDTEQYGLPRLHACLDLPPDPVERPAGHGL